MRMGLTALTLLSLATVAQAGIVVTNLGPTSSTSTAGNLTGYNSWKVEYFIANTAFDITAIDFWTPAVTSGSFAHEAFGIFSPANALAQRWVFNAGTEQFDPTPQKTNLNGSTSAYSLDSHFITTGTFPTQTPPTEDNDTLGLPGHPTTAAEEWGSGTYLRQLNTITPGDSVVIAYLVVPSNLTLVADANGGPVYGVGQIATTDPSAGPNGKVIVSFGVPEPGSLSLLALGGLAMLRRRR